MRVCVPLMFHTTNKSTTRIHSTQARSWCLRHNLFIYSPFISLSISMEHRNIFILPAAPPAQSSGKSLVISQVGLVGAEIYPQTGMERECWVWAAHTQHIINPKRRCGKAIRAHPNSIYFQFRLIKNQIGASRSRETELKIWIIKRPVSGWNNKIHLRARPC